MRERINTWVEKKWKDPVWSKVIANAIWYGPFALIGTLVLKAATYIDRNNWSKFKYSAAYFFQYAPSIPIWYYLTALLLILILLWVSRQLKAIRLRKSFNAENIIFDEIIGDYKFIDLYRILADEKLLDRTQKMRSYGIGPPNASLLELFGFYRNVFNDGLRNSVETIIGYRSNEEDGGYLIDVVAPKLLHYKLLNKIEEQSFLINHHVTFITYETSQIGYKFLDCWDRISTIQRNR